MRKEVLSVLTIVLLSGASEMYSEGRPEVSICQPSDCQVVKDQLAERIEESRAHLARLSHDDAVVMRSYDLLASELEAVFHKSKSLKSEEMQLIFKAIDFAAEKHRLQMRKNKAKTPYISHPLGVTYNLMHYGQVKDSAVIIGALLHDTIEDTQTTFEEIENAFGKQAASYVREMTNDKSLISQERRRLQVIGASKKSKGAAQIDLADQLFNVMELHESPPEAWSPIRIERYYQWVQSLIDRLPNANDQLKAETQKVINAYWEDQKPTDPQSKVASK